VTAPVPVDFIERIFKTTTPPEDVAAIGHASRSKVRAVTSPPPGFP
jgi:hypothetical protein